MKKHFNYLFCASIGLLVLGSSCKKSSSSSNPSVNNSLVTSVTSSTPSVVGAGSTTGSSSVEYLTYDSNQRLIHHVQYNTDSSNVNLKDTTTQDYIYSGNNTIPSSSTEIDITHSNTFTSPYVKYVHTYTLSGSNLITDYNIAYNNTGNVIDSSRADYTYSSNYNIKAIKELAAFGNVNNETDSSFISGQTTTRTSISIYSIGSNLYESFSYTLTNYTDPFYNIKVPNYSTNIGFGVNQYLPATQNEIITSNNYNTSFLTTYTYTLDSNGRVVKIVFPINSSNTITMNLNY